MDAKINNQIYSPPANSFQRIQDLPGPAGRIRSTWRLMKRPYETYATWEREFGKTFLVKALNGNVVVTSNTENIRRILAARHHDVSQFAIGTITPLIGEHSVLIVDGDQHKRARSMLTPPFRGQALERCAGTMRSVAHRVASDWGVGKTITVMDASLRYSLEVIIQVVFGVQEIARVETFKSAIMQYVSAFKPIFAFTKFFQRRWFPAWNKFLNQRRRFDELLNEQIQLGKRQLGEQNDILSLLLRVRDEEGIGLSDAELRDHLTTLLFAGHETTQIAIGWAMSWLHRNPDILNRLHNEIENADSFEMCLSSKLLEGVCLESLRLNAIVADFLRVFEQPIELEEINLPAKSTVGILSCNVHMDPDIYPAPEKFDPDRWTNNSYKPQEFLAFGGGIRKCIGATMAILEMKIALVVWLSLFKFELPADAPAVEPVHRRNLTMAPSSGIPLNIVAKQG